MKFKSVFAIIACIVLLFAAVSCGSSGGGQSSDSVKIELSQEDVTKMTPRSVTLNLLTGGEDDNPNDYGITWYVANDRKNEENGGENFVEITLKQPGQTEAEADFTGASRFYAERIRPKAFIYFRAQVCNLICGAQYFWRCGNGLGVYGEVGTINVPASDGESFTFMHVSDTQNTEGVTPENYYHKALALSNGIGGAEFAVHTGDMVQMANDDLLWREILSAKELLTLPVMPVSGNHDYGDGYGMADGTNETYRHYNIDIPKQDVTNGMYYSFDYKNCHFIMLNVGDIDTQNWQSQLDWLSADIAQNTQKWTVLSLHEPFYSLGNYGFQKENEHYNVTQIRQTLQPIIDGKVDLVLQGHDHMVQYTYPLQSGVVQNSAATTSEKQDGLGNTVTVDKYSLNGGTVFLMSGAAGDQNRNAGISSLAKAEDVNRFAFYMVRNASYSKYKREGASFSHITVTEEDITVFTYGFLPEGDGAEVITAVSICK